MMKRLYETVENAVLNEYERAREKFGATYVSPHEAYAVIKEEFQEAYEDLNEVGVDLEEKFWNSVRNNDKELADIAARQIYYKAVLTACEAVQTAAMTYKALQGYVRKDEENESKI